MAAPLPTVQQAIDGLYIVLYGRTADSLGYAAWAGFLGLSQRQIAAQQATAAQYQSLANAFITGEPSYYNATYPATMTNTQFVNALYMNLGGALGDAAGALYWTSLLNAGQSRASVVAQFTESFQSIDLSSQAASGLSAEDFAAAVLRQQTFTNKVIVSQYYAQLSATNSFLVATSTTDPAFDAVKKILLGVDATTASVAAAQAVIDAAVAAGSVAPIVDAPTVRGQIFNLTPSTDFIVGTAGNDTINAFIDTTASGGKVSTLSVGDNIDGGTGADILNIYVESHINDKMPSLATFKNVEAVNFYDPRTFFGRASVDASLFPGATQLWFVGNSHFVENIPASMTVGFRDMPRGGSCDIRSVAGAERITSVLDNVGEGFRFMFASTDTSIYNIKISGVVTDTNNDGEIADSLVNVDPDSVLRSLVVDSSLSIDLQIYKLGSSLRTIDASASAGGITIHSTWPLAPVAATVATIRSGSGDDAFTITTATSKTAGAEVNALASTGAGADRLDVNVTGDGKTSVDTGAGDDMVTILGRDASVLNVNLGDGGDTFVSYVTINGADVIDAGAGVDTLLLSLVGAANVGAFRNFDVYDVTGMGADLDVGILSAVNSITEIVGSGPLAAAVALKNVGAGVNFRATGNMGDASALTLTQKDGDAITITLDADQAVETAGDDFATMKINATNAASVTAVFDTAYKNVAGSQAGESAVTDNLSNIALTTDVATAVSVVSGGANAQNVLSLTDANNRLATVIVSGAQALNLGVASTVPALTTIDASAQTGGLTTSLAFLKDGGVIRLGSGTDVITATNASNPAGPESLQEFAKAAGVAVSVAPADATAKAAAIAVADKIVLPGGQVAANQDGVTAKVSDGLLTFKGVGPATLADAIALADTYAANLNDVLAFQYVGATYVFAQGDVGAVADDVLVRLVGVTGVTHLAENGVTDQFFVV